MKSISLISDKNIYSTIERAYREGNISLSRRNELFSEISTIFDEKINQFNHGMSTSLSKDSFRKIEKSINYMFVKGFRCFPDGYKMLSTLNINYFIKIGEEESKKELEEIISVYEKIEKISLNINNERYIDVIKNQIPKFISEAQEDNQYINMSICKYDLDYPLVDGLPLYNNMYGLDGTELVLYYINSLFEEVKFLNYFRNCIDNIVKTYEYMNQISIEYISINFFELVINQLIAGALIFNKPEIYLYTDDIKQLNKIVRYENIYLKLNDSINTICYYINDDGLKNYFNIKKNIIVENFFKLSKERIDFILNFDIINEGNIIDIESFSIDSSNLRKIIELLRNINGSKEKIRFIKSQNLGMLDIIDILESYIFSEEEIRLYYNSLSDIEIASLLKISFSEDFVFNKSIELNDINISNLSKDWERILLSSVIAKRDTKNIEKLIQRINIKIG
ncbi:hypothetical protein EXD82_05210 [Peptacetobacter hominis]|uniref:Uncharacterized protein n=1 Tax=Peptacetobacter hominis TaxID=2743610 RepID=A0A544QVT8_9FIRM|nr:DUF6179 domain-containing protein [Peptacetobacter hominis]TQQ84803.1 hypothetical protein EXD82_05210 [Peptacetobacter hominis]